MLMSSLAEPLCERLLRSFPATQSYTKADWEGDAMPAPMRHYLDHLLRHHGQREARRLRRARTDWVDYDHPEMEQAVRTFFATVEDHTQVPQDEWADTLRTATRRTTAHLVRPVSLLKSFVFDDHADPIAVSRIRWRMQFFGPYGYLREAVQAFAEKHDREALEPETFERVLRQVDGRMTADFGPDRWLRLLDPLFEMARWATGREQVPLSLLRTFFDEKKASRIVERLETYERESGAEAVAPETLHRLIETATQASPAEDHDSPAPHSAEQFLESPPESSSESPSPQDRPAPSSPEPDALSENDRTDEATPLWKRFQQGQSRQEPDSDGSRTDGSQPLWTRFEQGRTVPRPDTETEEDTPPQRQPTSPPRSQSGAPEDALSSLERDVLGTGNPSHRGVYVQKLFQGDEAAYRRVLEQLRAAESWSEASQIIASEVFQAYQVNIYSDPAVHFTDAVEARFKE